MRVLDSQGDLSHVVEDWKRLVVDSVPISPKYWFAGDAEALRWLGYDARPLGKEWNEARHFYFEENRHPLPELLSPVGALPSPFSNCLGELRGSKGMIRLFSGYRYALPLTFLKKVKLSDGTKLRVGQPKAQARLFSLRAAEVVEAQERGLDVTAALEEWIDHLDRWLRIDWRSEDQWMREFIKAMIDLYLHAGRGDRLRRSKITRIGKGFGVF